MFEQVMEVNKLFQTYKDITKSEKILIISFLSGNRGVLCVNFVVFSRVGCAFFAVFCVLVLFFIENKMYFQSS